MVATCALTATADSVALSSASPHKLTAMTTVVAPAAAREAARAPLDIVAVVDRSGSMSSEKMNLVKETLQLLAQRAGLRSNDKLAIVTFDQIVDTPLPLVSMDADGRARTTDVAARLHPGGATNLSGGLLRGLELIGRALDSASTGSRTRAVLLFTDGMANHGITDESALVSAAQGAMEGRGLTTIFTFGFGADHQEDLLKALAQGTNGLYYYIEGADDIPTAFADCLGGLTSIVAQNATLTLCAPEGYGAIERVCGSYKACTTAEGVLLELGDLYAEDEKDVIVELTLPPLPSPLDAPADGPPSVLRATLRYFCVATSRMEEAAAAVGVARPAETPAEQPINLRLDEQRNRVRVAEAMAEAARLADAGRLDAGRALLAGAIDAIGRSSSANTPLSVSLSADVAKLAAKFANVAVYRSTGSKCSKMSAMCHAQQRSSHSSAPMYERPSKTIMKREWHSAR